MAAGVLDRLPEMLTTASQRLVSVRDRTLLIQGDVTRLPFADESFDGVFAESVLGMQDSGMISATLGEIARVLKPDCRFVANEAIWKPDTLREDMLRITRDSIADFGLRPASEDPWSLEDWLRAIRRVGLAPVSWDRLAPMTLRDRLRSRVSQVETSARLLSSPARRADERHYRARLARHRRSESAIEARLFVARKPSVHQASCR